MQTLAVVGLGNISNRHRKNCRQLFPNATILAVSASGKQVTKAIPDCDELVANINGLIERKPDMVIVASPASLHDVHAIALLEAGIPTLVEKPLTANVEQALALKNCDEKHGTPSAVAYCLRYLPAAGFVKQLLDSGELGDVYNVSAHVGQYLPTWRPSKDFHNSVSAQAALGGGALRELSHELDYCSWLFGDLTVKHAVLRSSQELNLEVEDLVDIVAVTPDQVVCNIHLNFLEKAVKRQCIVLAEHGTLVWDFITNTIALRTASGEELLFSDPEWDRNGNYLAMIEDFVAKIDNKANQCASIASAVNIMQLIEEIESIAEHQIS